MAMMTISVNNRVPTHYCRVCGALWFKGADHWSLVSLHCGKCCDNALMGNQIVALEDPTGPEPGCQDCAKEGRFLCDTHGPEPAIPVVIESLSVAPDREAARRFVEDSLIPAAQGQSVGVDAAVLLRAAQERSGERRRSLVLRDDALHAIALALSAQAPSADEHERQVLQLIDQRDQREHIIDLLCDAVLGVDRHEWSSAYCYENAVVEVQERMDALTAGASVAAPQVEAPRQMGDDLLRAIADNYWKVDPFDMPMPGGDDADVGWRISEYMRHGERVVVECYRDDLPGAIREAIAATAKPSGEGQ